MAAAIVLVLPGMTAHAAIDLSKGITGNYYDGQGNVMPYWLFRPDGYNSGQAYPLVLFLHGSTDGGKPTSWHNDNLFAATQGAYGAQYKSFLLVPQVQVPPGNYTWNATASENMSKGLLDQMISNYHIDTRRLYITGLSMGGFGTFDYIARFPHTFAAASPLSGGGDPSTAAIIKNTPIWAFHGGGDTVVPPSNTDAMYNAVQAAGGHMEYTRPAGVGHSNSVWQTFYNNTTYTNSKGQTLYPWMFSQTLLVPEPSSIVLLGAGAVSLFACGRRRRRPRGGRLDR
jgi:predicted peptidase